MHSFWFYLPIISYFSLLVYYTFQIKPGLHQHDKQYYLADRKIKPLSSVLSVMATETSVATIMVFPAVGMKSNYILLWLCLGYILGRTLIAFCYLPKLYGQTTLSIYETITQNSPKAKKLLSASYLLAKFISSGVRFYMAGFALSQLFGGSIVLWSCGTTVLVALYSIRGGLKAVVFTDQIQAYVILGMGVLLCFLLYPISDGINLSQVQWINTTAAYTNALFFPAMLLGGMVVSIGSHAADQDLLQRVLATPSLKQAQMSLIASGFAASVVIGLYLSVGVLLSGVNLELDASSPLVSYIQQSDQPLLMGLFAVLIFAAAMSTLDSASNSTALIWKSLFESSNKPNRFWSTLSLLCLLGFSLSFIVLKQYSDDFLSLAMGSMNYINGALIGVLTLFILAPKKISFLGICAAIPTGFFVTYAATWLVSPSLAWTWTIIASSFCAFCAAYLCGSLKKN